MLPSIPSLQDDEEDVSYGVESLFTNIPVPVCSKLIFRKLLIKLAAECTFNFNNRFLKQVDNCTMEGPLSVTFSDIYMVKRGKNDVVIHLNLSFIADL